jgi:gluconate 2-dehydrogenase gamma chain
VSIRQILPVVKKMARLQSKPDADQSRGQLGGDDMQAGDKPGWDRRNFLKSLGAAGAAGAIPVAVASSAAAQPAPAPMGGPAQMHGMPTFAAKAQSGPVWQFFNEDEAVFIRSAVDCLIPADAVGPGALESGVADYIDRQMASGYGRGARMYQQGPFAEGVPQQGWQFPLTPAELIRVGIADADNWSRATHGKRLADLAVADRTAALGEIDAGHANFANVPAGAFFNLLLQLTMEGYFGDPAYGGNRDMAVWKMLGFPGVAGMYSEDIETYLNKPYPTAPRSIADPA